MVRENFEANRPDTWRHSTVKGLFKETKGHFAPEIAQRICCHQWLDENFASMKDFQITQNTLIISETVEQQF